jgi:heme exporter protein C
MNKINSKFYLVENFLLICFVLFFPFSIFLSLYYPNVILEQGTAHRIFYFHVGVAWVALYAPLFSTVFGLIYLFTKKLNWDLLSYSMAKLALVFSLGVLFSGPIWAYSAWGVFWDKTDARLQSFLILLISLISYFVLRALNTDPIKRAKVSAIMSFFCTLNAILTWGAIRWIENPGNHPGSVLGKGKMDPDMKLTFWVSIFAYHLLFLILFIIFYRKSKIDQLKEKLQYQHE